MNSNRRRGTEADQAMFGVMKNVLKEEGWTQRRLCAALGHSEAWLSQIIHAGRGMDLTDLMRICEVTGIPPSRLLAGYPCPQKISEEDEIAKRLYELLPEDVRRRLIELEKAKPK